MKIWTSEHVFEHPWETVAKAALRKYPNPLNPNVVSLDVVDRYVDKDGVLRSHRLMSTSWGMPRWVTGLIGMHNDAHVSEHSEIDPKTHTYTLRSRNLTLNNYLTVEEKLVYTPHPELRHSTLLRQEATITVNGIPLGDQLENMVENTMASQANKGRQAMELVIKMLKDEAEGINRVMQESIDSVKKLELMTEL